MTRDLHHIDGKLFWTFSVGYVYIKLKNVITYTCFYVLSTYGNCKTICPQFTTN